MLLMPGKKQIIVGHDAVLHRYTNNSCTNAAQVYKNLEKNIGCSYLIYLYENLITNEKYVYSSNWEWQNLLIGERLINNCPLFLNVSRLLKNKKFGHVLFPWHQAPPTNKEERTVCGLRSEFNISNGFGYAIKGYGIRETLGFGASKNDTRFYKNFIADPNILYSTLQEMRLSILFRNQEHRCFSEVLGIKQ